MQNALLHWDAEGMPCSVQYGDIYYSKTDALGESTHVFVQGNSLSERFAALEATDHFVIGELGFGAGLNFLNTCISWWANAPASARLHYLACELHPFTLADLRRLLLQFPALHPCANELLKFYPDHTAGAHQFTLQYGAHKVILTLLYGDALTMLQEYFAVGRVGVHAWFFDGFAPKVNPALWETPLLQLVARSTLPDTTLASYSVASSFRRALTQANFSFSKRRGFTGKRHMLQARFTGVPAYAGPSGTLGTVCVVGGGLAGSSTAYALADAGWEVILLEHSAMLATGGSGNLQGILHCKPTTADTRDNQFNLHTYLHAQRHYSALRDRQGLAWHQCGMLHIGFNADQQRRFARVLDTGRYSPAIMRKVEAAEASEIAGVRIGMPCLYFPGSGWLTPAAVCELYSRHPRITVYTGQKVRTLERRNARWRVHSTTAQGDMAVEADVVVLCNGADAYDFPQCRSLPIISNRGQVDVYTSSADTEVNTILCGQGYVLPAGNGLQSIGGSYYVEGTSLQKNQQLHLDLLGRMQPELAKNFSRREPVQQRVAQRCQTPDRMPLVGVVDAEKSPGLYINVGHGSNGLARTPLCAAYLTSMLSHSPSPLEGRLASVLDPARFSQVKNTKV